MPNTKTAPTMVAATAGAYTRATEATRTLHFVATLRGAGEIPHAVPQLRS